MPEHLDILNHIKKRPKMYLGNGVPMLSLIEGLLSDCIALCRTDAILFSINILGNAKFQLTISSERDIAPFTDCFTDQNFCLNSYCESPGHCSHFVLIAIAKNLEISKTDAVFSILAEIDKAILPDAYMDHSILGNKLLQFAMLNRGVEILIADHSGKFANQNYFHIPEGVFYQFDAQKREFWPHDVYEIRFDDAIEQYTYQIALAFVPPFWGKKAMVTSYANDLCTNEHGTLVEGIDMGILKALRIYCAAKGIEKKVFQKKNLSQTLLLVCSVRGEGLMFRGSVKQALANLEIKAQISKLVRGLMLDFLNADPERATKVIGYFR